MSSKIRLKSQVNDSQDAVELKEIHGTNFRGQLPFSVAAVTNDPNKGVLPEQVAALVKQTLENERNVSDNLVKKAVQPPQPV